MEKRIMSILLALCLCITFLSACGGGSSGTTGAQTPATDSLQSGNSSNGLDESGDEASNNGETDEPNSLDSSFAGADVGVTVDSLGAYTIGIKSDGTVIVSGDKQFGRCKQEDVDDWRDIVSITASEYYAVGLKSNGTVVVSDDRYFDPGKWHNVVGIDAGLNHTVGVRDDGTVVVGGRQEYTEELFNVDDWTDIIAASAGTGHTVGLKSDGTVVAVGYMGIDEDGKRITDAVDHWTDIIAISAGDSHTVGLKSDGTVVTTDSFNGDVSGWHDIKMPNN